MKKSETAKEEKQKQKKKKPEDKKQKVAYRCARHRLLSIHRDCESLQDRVRLALRDDDAASFFSCDYSDSWQWIAQCGSWYLPNPSSSASCYFKSTDGHVGTYAISLKRLNLSLLQHLFLHGGCYLVDSSARKLLPGSFSRTILIWACVMNRIVQRYRLELELELDNDEVLVGGGVSYWDTNLYTPAFHCLSQRTLGNIKFD
jgi:hypothetical protein